MMSTKSKNISFNTSASWMTLVTIKILMVILLQGQSSSVFATPLFWEPEWSAIVVPITQSLATAQNGRFTAQSKDSRWWNHLTTLADRKSARTMTEAPRLYSTCRGLSCRDMNHSYNRHVEDYHDKNHHGQNNHATKRCGNNHHEKKRCGGKNQQNKPCGKNQNQKHCGKNQCEKRCGKNQCEKRCGKNQCEKRCGKNQGKKHCGEKQNGQSHHDTTNCNRQNKRKNNMQNCNKRRQFVVDNKVIINVNDGRTPDSTLLPRIETTVAEAQVSIVSQSVEHHRCSSFYGFWYSDIIWLLLLAICVAITFCIYKLYFISDRYYSIMY